MYYGLILEQRQYNAIHKRKTTHYGPRKEPIYTTMTARAPCRLRDWLPACVRQCNTSGDHTSRLWKRNSLTVWRWWMTVKWAERSQSIVLLSSWPQSLFAYLDLALFRMRSVAARWSMERGFELRFEYNEYRPKQERDDDTMLKTRKLLRIYCRLCVLDVLMLDSCTCKVLSGSRI
jgi:hypothetical protein